jgi:hypothetical protein
MFSRKVRRRLIFIRNETANIDITAERTIEGQSGKLALTGAWRTEIIGGILLNVCLLFQLLQGVITKERPT